MPVALDGLNRAQEAAVTHADGPLVVAAGAGTGKTHTVVQPLRLARGPGRARRADPRAHLLRARRGRAARAARGRARGALRGAARGDLPLVLPAPAPGRGARGGRGSVPVAGHAGGPPRAAARAPRRAVAARARDPRQPGAAARQLRLAHRPPEGRDGLGRRLPRPRRAAAWARRTATPRAPAPRASSSSPACTPTTTACLRSAERSTSATSSCAPSSCSTSVRTCGERVAAPLPARAGGRVRGHQLRPGHAAAPA